MFLFAVVVLGSPAGAMLSRILHSLLLLPTRVTRLLLHELLCILPHLDALNRLLPISKVEDLELAWPARGMLMKMIRNFNLMSV